MSTKMEIYDKFCNVICYFGILYGLMDYCNDFKFVPLVDEELNMLMNIGKNYAVDQGIIVRRN